MTAPKRPSVTVLSRLAKTTPSTQIAEQYGVTPSTVSRWLRDAGIAAHGRHDRLTVERPSPEHLRVWSKTMTTAEIAEMLGVHTSNVSRWLQSAAIRPQTIDAKEAVRLYRSGMSLREVAATLLLSERTVAIAVKAKGVIRRRGPRTRIDPRSAKKVRDMRSDGLSWTVIAVATGLPRTTVRRIGASEPS